MRAERERLHETIRKDKHWRRWGPYLAERAWGTARGLQRRRNRLGLFPVRALPSARLPLGRGRHRRHLRQSSAPVFRVGLLERPRSDSEGAPLRPQRPAGQSRRGRQGVLLLPRFHADALLHEVPVQVSAGRVSLLACARWMETAPARAGPEFELIDTGIFDQDRYFDIFIEYAKADRGRHPDSRVTVANRGPEPATLHLLPTLWFRNTWSGATADTALRSWSARTRIPSRLENRSLGVVQVLASTVIPPLLFTENETNARALWNLTTARAVRQGRVSSLRDPWRTERGESGRDAAPRRAACTSSNLRPARPKVLHLRLHSRQRRGIRMFTISTDFRGANPRSRRVLLLRSGDAFRTMQSACSGRPSPACCGPSSSITSWSSTWLKGDPASPLRRRERLHGTQRAMDPPVQRRRDFDAGQMGISVVRRLGSGVSHDSVGDGRSGFRQDTSCAVSARMVPASRTGRFRPTNGHSAT